MSLDEACAAGGVGEEATDEGDVIPPKEEDMEMPPGEDTEEGEPPTQEDVNVNMPLAEDTVAESINMPPAEDTVAESIDMPPAEETVAESSNVKQEASSTSAGEIGKLDSVPTFSGNNFLFQKS